MKLLTSFFLTLSILSCVNGGGDIKKKKYKAIESTAKKIQYTALTQLLEQQE